MMIIMSVVFSDEGRPGGVPAAAAGGKQRSRPVCTGRPAPVTTTIRDRQLEEMIKDYLFQKYTPHFQYNSCMSCTCYVILEYLLLACRKVMVSVFDISGCESTLPVLFTPS